MWILHLLTKLSVFNFIWWSNVKSSARRLLGLDSLDKQMYTKPWELSGYVESTYHGGTIFMVYDLNEYENKPTSIERVLEKHIPFHIMRSLLTCTDEFQQVFGRGAVQGRSSSREHTPEPGSYQVKPIKGHGSALFPLPWFLSCTPDCESSGAG